LDQDRRKQQHGGAEDESRARAPAAYGTRGDGSHQDAHESDREDEQPDGVGAEPADRAQPQRKPEEHAVEDQVDPTLLAEYGGKAGIGHEPADIEERCGCRPLA
jgi:hypothetical protein